MNPSDFYSKKKYKIKLSKYKTEDASLNQKLDDLQVHLDNGFILYSTRIMERFLLGHTDIKNFADQFILLEDALLLILMVSIAQNAFRLMY